MCNRTASTILQVPENHIKPPNPNASLLVAADFELAALLGAVPSSVQAPLWQPVGDEGLEETLVIQFA